MIDPNMSPLEQLVMDDAVLISTIDNPINPFIDFDAWYDEDLRLGHDTCGTVARHMADYTDMSLKDYSVEYARVVRELFANDPYNLYTLVKRTTVINTNEDS